MIDVAGHADRLDHPHAQPAIAAIHAARSALTVAGGRVALARRRAARGADIDRVARDLARVPEELAEVARAIETLAALALADAGTPSGAGGTDA